MSAPAPTQTATLHTSSGDIRIVLYGNHAPKTVANFVELAQGTREWTHPETRQKTTDPLYDGTVFHRVIDGFMIQGGDPLGEGYGGPGYKFADEFHPELHFDRPYLLAMANSGAEHQRLAVLHHRRRHAAPEPQAHHLRRGGRRREPGGGRCHRDDGDRPARPSHHPDHDRIGDRRPGAQ